MVAVANRQRGISLSGLLVVAVVLILAAILGMKVIPVYIQDKEIKAQFEEMARDPELKDASRSAILTAFSKRAMVADITAVKEDDIAIDKDANGITLSASYTVKVPLFGNASLLFEFSPSSSK